MKSFADWTQELAESVGEIRHHWEEPKVEDELYEPVAPCDDWGLGSDDAALTPNWQNPGAVPSKECCYGCQVRDGTVGKRFFATNSMVYYHLCASCARNYGYGEIVS